MIPQGEPVSPDKIIVEVHQAASLMPSIIALGGVFVGAAITYFANVKLENYRRGKDKESKEREFKGLFQVFVLELVNILERCVQYIEQVAEMTVPGDASGVPGAIKISISKSIIHLQFGAGQLERIQTLGADWRIARCIYTAYEIAGQVNEQLDRIPADYQVSTPSLVVAMDRFRGIAAFVDETIYQEKLLPSVSEVLASGKVVLPHEFIVEQEKRVKEIRRKYDAVRPPKAS